MRIVIIGCWLVVAGTMWSQDTLLSTLSKEKAALSAQQFCNPGLENKSRTRGVEIYYTMAGSGLIERRDVETKDALAELQSYEHFGLKLYVPIILKPNIKLLLGYAYQPERYRYDGIGSELQPLLGNLNNRLLKSNSFNILLTTSLGATKYLAIRTKIAFNGTYDGWINFDQRYQTYNAIGLLGFKKRDDFEWGVGLYYTQNMRRQLLLPFAMMNKNFNDKWGIELAPPAYVLLRYNSNPKTILLAGAEFHSRMYSIDSEALNIANNVSSIYTMNHHEVLASISMERQIIPWLWFGVKGGYQYNIHSRFEPDASENPAYRVRLPAAPFFQASIFLSPPDDMK